MSDVIRNCEFRFKCPQTWDSLETTAVAAQRFCKQCQTTVHYCWTPAQLEQAIVKNLCVAVRVVDAASLGYGGASDENQTLKIGEVTAFYQHKP
jgi:hypothetical protein